MEDPAKETVIIVHGTWAGLEPGKNRWYQPVGIIDAAHSFTAKLDAALKERGSPARCWAHCTQSDQIFHWSGSNDWIARTRAAAALADYVAKFQNKGWVCHIIGHSHGGNVVVEAAASNEPLGKLVTLGTPFLDTMSPIWKNAQRLRRVIRILSVVAMLSMSLSACVYDFLSQGIDLQKMTLLIATCLVLIIGAVLIDALISWFSRRRTRNQVNVFQTPRMQKTLSTLSQTHQFHTPLLAIGSPMDEAWQVLHHLGSIDNPLAIRSGLLRYLFSPLRSQMSRDAEIAH
jgi:pimeloyl-ACP methyl ester carboxylesterase